MIYNSTLFQARISNTILFAASCCHHTAMILEMAANASQSTAIVALVAIVFALRPAHGFSFVSFLRSYQAPPMSNVKRSGSPSEPRLGTALRGGASDPTHPSTDSSPYLLELTGSGDLIFQPSTHDSDVDPTVLLSGLAPNAWSVDDNDDVRTDRAHGVFLRTAHHDSKCSHDTAFGQLASCERLLASARLTRYWMGPRFGTTARDIPLDTQFLLIEVSKGGPYALILPLLDGGFRSSLKYGRGKSGLTVHEESGDNAVTSSGTRSVHVSVGDDPYALLKSSFADVADTTGTFSTLDSKELPPSVDDFGWCTWDAFYSEVTPEGVVEGVESLRKAGAQPRSVILDDGWQQVAPKKMKKDTETKEPQKITAKLANGLLSVLAKVVSALYEKFVRKAPHGSIPNRIWRFLTRSVLKGQLLHFFDSETDFARQLSGFGPNDKFSGISEDGSKPTGLKELVNRLKSDLGVRRIYCWHALHGYWRGASPELGKAKGFNATNIVPQLSNHLLQVEPVLAWDSVSLFGVGLVTNEQDLKSFYSQLHAPLVEAGVDGIKVDVQSGVSSLGGGSGGGARIAQLYTAALEESVRERFSSSPDGAPACINCMCHSTENLYRYKTTSMARASDDFYPDRRSSHTVHLVNVAYNSLFIGEICLPDWDMFHSKHESAALHAAARAVGGCAVYVSDKPGQHDGDLLKKLVLPDGSVLRGKYPGRPTRDSLFQDVGSDKKSALKIWNANDLGGVIGAFNVQGVRWNFSTHENEVVDGAPHSVSAAIRPHDIETLRDHAGPFVAWVHNSSSLTYLSFGDSEVSFELSHRDWVITTIVPLETSSGGVSWAPIGLADMLNTGGALSNVGEMTVSSETQKASTEFCTRGPGRFVAYCSQEPSELLLVKDSQSPLPFTYDIRSGLLTFFLPSEQNGEPHRVSLSWEKHTGGYL